MLKMVDKKVNMPAVFTAPEVLEIENMA